MSQERPALGRLADVARAPLTVPFGVARGIERRTRRIAADAVIATADAWLSSRELERIVTAVVEHEGSERIADRILDSALARHVARRAADAGVVDALLDALAERERFWALIDRVASSPAVSDAIAHQSRSAATDVLDGVRDGAAQADDWLERIARRMAGRRSDA